MVLKLFQLIIRDSRLLVSSQFTLAMFYLVYESWCRANYVHRVVDVELELGLQWTSFTQASKEEREERTLSLIHI